ncbi:MAG: hypothetical protein C0501_28520 [Isosphaera sp.]|nr:hypothetical protein [Isosphaera sp.]
MRTAAAALALLALAAWHARPAAPPQPPPAFAADQSPPKPPPFPVTLVDQGKFDPALKGYLLPEGFRLEVVVSEPDTVNPVGMTFGPDGSLYVLEWRPDPVTNDRWFEVKETFRYRDGSARQIATMKKFTTDLVKQFKPDPATGRFGPPKVIIAEELPSSVLYHDGWLYVTGRGTVRRWRQSPQGGALALDRPATANDPWALRETVAQGFCGFHHHQVSGVSIGNDGLLYLTSGDDDNFAEGSDGSRATVLRTGAVFRCKPDGSNLETFSIGYRNPYRDLAHDDKFNWFHVDNDQEDGSRFQGCRLVHVAEGADFGWRLQGGARCCRTDRVRGAVGGELPGKVPPMHKTGRGSPAGLLIYHDTRLPEPYRGLLFYPDVFRRLVRAYTVAPDGSTFQVTHEFEFLKSDDPLFRPCQMVTGPDGAVYVCDWRTDSGGAGKLSGDGKHGRVYRITWAGTKDTPALPRRGMDAWAKLRQLPDDQLADALGLPDLTDRVEARKELVRRGPKARDLVLKKLVSGGLDGDARLPALGVLLAHWNAEVEDFCRLLGTRGASPDVRRAALDGLGLHARPADARAVEALVKALGDRHPAVRRAAALALGRVGGEAAPGALVAGYLHDLDGDVFLRDGYLRGLEKLGKPGIDALLALAATGDRERNQAVEAFLALRTKPAADALPELLARPDVSAEQREALVRSYTNYQFDPPLPLDPLADYLARRPDEAFEVVRAAVEVFAASGPANAERATPLVVGLLNRPQEEARMVAIRAAEEARLTAAAPKLIELLADPARPAAERAAAVKAVRVLGDKKAAAPLAALLGGTHPAALKAEALRSLAALDPPAARAAAEKLLDQPDPTLLTEAVIVLSATRPGAVLIGERLLAKKLPRDFFPQVADALQKFDADPAVARLRAEVVRGGLLLSTEPGQVEKVRTLVAEKGDPRRGREVYLNTKLLACASCHRLEGVGGSVGPDLTKVWETMTVEKLVESIADPGKEIKEGYQTYRLTTTGDQVHTGLKVKEDAREVVLRDANGRDVRVAKDEVASLTPTKVSLMPDNSVAQLRHDQFIDLLAFLKSRTEQESLRGTVREGMVTGPFGRGFDAGPPAAVAEAKWVRVAAAPDGTFDPTGGQAGWKNAGVYFRTYVHAPKAQTAALTVTGRSATRVWVNGGGGADPAKPVAADLKAGWNVVVVAVEDDGRPAPLGVRVAGDDLRTAARPE